MKRLRAWVRYYFGFSKTETNGFLLLLPLMSLCIFSEPVYRWWFIHYGWESKDNVSQLDSITSRWTWPAPSDSAENDIPLFSFDPNVASVKEFTSLGLSEKLSARIINYRTKGGKFRLKRDFQKIYGMDSLLAMKLMPYILLPETLKLTSPIQAKKVVKKQWTRPPPPKPFDLNLADTTALAGIYGIGSKLAKRIVTYRTRLGGFLSTQQLYEIYGLDTAVIGRLEKKSFITSAFEPERIDINTDDVKSLTRLPYIRFHLANAITTYRRQHGNFKAVEDLKKIVLLDDVTFQKIKPYLTVKE